MSDTKHAAYGKWRDILSNYIETEYLTGKHTKCPLCGGKDRFRFDDKGGNGSYFCAHCGPGTGIHLLSNHQGIAYTEAWKLVEKVIGTAKAIEPAKIDELGRVKSILATCTEGGELVMQYLASRYIKNAPESLLAGFVWIDKAKCPAMIAKAAKGSKLAGIHATAIKDGVKIARRMFAVEKGAMIGSAIRLHKLNGGSELLVAEGIETALSAAEIAGIPAWSCMDAGKLMAVQIPDQITRVVIASDNDDSFTGQAAAYALAKRLKSGGKQVEIMMPERIGNDWNDELRIIRQAESACVAEKNK